MYFVLSGDIFEIFALYSLRSLVSRMYLLSVMGQGPEVSTWNGRSGASAPLHLTWWD